MRSLVLIETLLKTFRFIKSLLCGMTGTLRAFEEALRMFCSVPVSVPSVHNILQRKYNLDHIGLYMFGFSFKHCLRIV